MLKITCYAAFLRFFRLYGTYSVQVVQTWLVWYETWHTILFGKHYRIEMVKIEKNSHMLEIMC